MRKKCSLYLIVIHGQFSVAVGCLVWTTFLYHMLAGPISISMLQAGHPPSVQSEKFRAFSEQGQINGRSLSCTLEASFKLSVHAVSSHLNLGVGAGTYGNLASLADFEWLAIIHQELCQFQLQWLRNKVLVKFMARHTKYLYITRGCHSPCFMANQSL